MADNTILPGTGESIATDDIGGVKYQRVKVAFGDDGSASDASPTNALPISVNAANFIISTNNSSTSQLAAAATFTGTIETALNQPCISIMLTCDQPVTLTVQQFIDVGGTYRVTDMNFSVPAGTGFNRAFTLNGNYCRVKVTNNGTATTTTLNLNTAYGTLPPAASDGNLPVGTPDSAVTSGSLSANGTLFSIDASAFTTLVCSLSGTWFGNVKFQTSFDGVNNWTDVPCYPVAQTLNPSDATAGNGLVLVPIVGRFVQAVVFGYQSGTVVASGMLKSGSIADYAHANIARALDRTEGVELHTRVIGSAQREIQQDPATGVLLANQGVQNYRCAVQFLNHVPLDVPCDNMTIMTVMPSGGTLTTSVEGMYAHGWQQLVGQAMNTTIANAGAATTIVNPTGTPYIYHLMGASRVRFRCSAYTSGTAVMTVQLAANPNPAMYANGAAQVGTWNIGTVTTVSTLSALATPTTNMLSSAATTNATSVKASAGTVYSVTVSNTGAAAAYLKYYNKASAPTVGTDVPVITVSVPASGTVAIPATDFGIRFSTGIALAITNLAADSDTTAVAAAQVKVITAYI